MSASAGRLRPSRPLIVASVASLFLLAGAGLLWAKYGGRIYVDAILATIAGCF